MPGRNFLFVPGPTNVPERILRAMDRAMEDHRSSAFPDLTAGLFRDLQKGFQTTHGQALVFPATGTAGWGAALPPPPAPPAPVVQTPPGPPHPTCIYLPEPHRPT